MRTIKSIVVMTMMLAAVVAHAEDSAPFPLDTVTPSTLPMVDSLPISWDSAWIGGNMSATVVVADNGTEVRRVAGTGEFTYAPSTVGRHELTYTTYIGGVIQNDTYSMSFYSGWKYKVEGGGAVITETVHTGGAVSILNEIDGYPVTGIASGVFQDCTRLTSVTIPDSVTSIGTTAFAGCSALKDVTVPQYVCSTKLSSVFPSIYQAITNIVISDLVTNIGDYAFSDCSGLTSVTIPDNVTSIGASSFAGCSGLRDVAVPQYVCSATLSSVFPSAYGTITNVVVSDLVTSIGDKLWFLQGGILNFFIVVFLMC